MTPILSARAIVRLFSPRPEDKVLKGLDLDVAPGEILAVVGPSGVGKTTLLNILGLLDQPTEGSVLYGGRDSAFCGKDLVRLSRWQQAAVRNRIFGFVFQLYHLLPDLSVIENIMLPALMGGRGGGYWSRRRAARVQAQELLEEVGIGDKANARPTDLSGGEKQRAAIARALAARPEIVFCDEPTGNLDTATSERIHGLLWRLNRDHGVTLVLVTHNPDLAQRAHRILRMVDGRFVGEERHAASR